MVRELDVPKVGLIVGASRRRPRNGTFDALVSEAILAADKCRTAAWIARRRGARSEGRRVRVRGIAHGGAIVEDLCSVSARVASFVDGRRVVRDRRIDRAAARDSVEDEDCNCSPHTGLPTPTSRARYRIATRVGPCGSRPRTQRSTTRRVVSSRAASSSTPPHATARRSHFGGQSRPRP